MFTKKHILGIGAAILLSNGALVAGGYYWSLQRTRAEMVVASRITHFIQTEQLLDGVYQVRLATRIASVEAGADVPFTWNALSARGLIPPSVQPGLSADGQSIYTHSFSGTFAAGGTLGRPTMTLSALPSEGCETAASMPEPKSVTVNGMKLTSREITAELAACSAHSNKVELEF